MKTKKITSIVLLVFTFTFSYAQKEFYFAREYQSLSHTAVNSLETYKSHLSDREQKDWNNFYSFFNNPLVYINSGKPTFDPQILLKLQKIKREADINAKLSAGKLLPPGVKDPLFEQTEHPASLIPSTAEFTSKILYASGQLLLERAKQELYNTHFQQVKKVFEEPYKYTYKFQNSEEVKDSFAIKDILPNSYLVISQFDELTQPQVGTTLQKAFEQDLEQFHQNMTKHMLPEKIKEQWPYLFMDVAIQGITDLSGGVHPSNVLKNMTWQYNEIPTSGTNHTPKQQISIGLNLLNVISESLVDYSISDPNAFVENKGYWINKKEFSALSINGYEYYICLLYLNNQAVFNAMKIAPEIIIDANNSKYKQIKLLVEEILVQLESVESILVKFKEDDINNKSDLLVDYTQSFVSLLDVIEPILCDISSQSQFCDDYLALRKEIDIALTIPAEVKNKEYATAFLKSYQIGMVFYDHYRQGSGDSFGKNADLVRYLTLANDIVQADSIDQIKAVLDAAILPIGSYSMKRSLKNTVAINGYVGIGGGVEKILNNKLNTNFGGQFGPFAPIGIDYSWGTKNGHSNGLFLSIIDLGAVVNMYFQNSDSVKVENENGMEINKDINVETLPELKIKNVFAPGLFYVHGWKNSPISCGAGFQLAPDLREVSLSQGTEVSMEDIIRISAFIAIDIPLFTISKGRKK